MKKHFSQIRPMSLDSFAVEQDKQAMPQPILSNQGITPIRHISICAGDESSVQSSHAQARSNSFFGFKSKYMAAKPSILAPLLQPFTPQEFSQGQHHTQPVAALVPPQTTRVSNLQLPITPLGPISLNQQQVAQPSYKQQSFMQLAPVSLMPMTPQMGGNMGHLRRAPVRPQLDETLWGDHHGVCIRKTHYRRAQEDRYLTKENFRGANYNGCFAVLDGHGGQRAAEYAKTHLPTMLEEQTELESATFDSIRHVFKQLDEQFLSIARQDCSPDGSTCLLALILNGRLTIANIGDSIATRIHKDGSWVQLNSEHNPNRLDEKARIESAGGFVFNNRVEGDLQVSRSFGDYEIKHLVISEPEGNTWPITRDDDLLILASDGIHNSITQAQMVARINYLRQQNKSLANISETIVEECLRMEGQAKSCNDNVTLLIVSLSDYLTDFERRGYVNAPQQLMLRKQSSVGHGVYDSSQKDLAVECHSLLQLSSENGARLSGVSGNASQVSTNVNVNPFILNSSSNPSSQTSSPQQFINPKQEDLPRLNNQMGTM